MSNLPLRAVAAAAGMLAFPALAADEDAVKRGEYIFNAAGCLTCHTDTKNKGAPLAGGRAIKTRYGTYYSPNITPDKETGIGKWTDAQFIRALREGVDADDGDAFFPVFPYTSFTRMTDRDMRDLKAYLFSRKPVRKRNRPHDTNAFFGIRPLVWVWQLLYFTPGPFKPDPAKDAEWNRGAYLVKALAHCGECHTPRTFLGAADRSRLFAGTPEGPEGGVIPNITPDKETGIGKWKDSDILALLEEGIFPDGDYVGGGMADVVEHSTSKLTDADRKAIVRYLRSIPPIRYSPRAEAEKAKKEKKE